MKGKFELVCCGASVLGLAVVAIAGTASARLAELAASPPAQVTRGSTPSTGVAATIKLVLSPSALLIKGVMGFPRIVSPKTAATDAINAALQRADALAIADATDCAHNAGPQPAGSEPAWTRSITVTMRTGRLLSLLAVDNLDCGGTHPDVDFTALVYDVGTGAPVNWPSMFPKSFGAAAVSNGPQDILVSSPKLDAWMEKYEVDSGAPECKGAYFDDFGYVIWPDPQAGGLTVYASVAPVDRPCAGPATIPYATLKAFGVSHELIAQIQRAQAHKLYEKEP